MNKSFKKILSIVLSVMMISSLMTVSLSVSAVQDGKVRVIVRNDTYSVENGAPWDGVLVDEARIVDELFVLLEHGTADGRDEVAGGLDALYGSEFFAGDNVVALIGHVDIDDVAESVLGIVGDSDEADVAVDAHVFVGGGIVGFHLVGDIG